MSQVYLSSEPAAAAADAADAAAADAVTATTAAVMGESVGQQRTEQASKAGSTAERVGG